METKSSEHYTQFIVPFRKALDSLNKEADRGMIIVAASWVDKDLENAISSLLIPSSKKDDELFLDTGLLGTFSAKIDMAFRLGLIKESSKNTLHLLRKMRNECAHNIESSSFDTPSIESRTIELARKVEDLLTAMWKGMEDLLKNQPNYKNYNPTEKTSKNIRTLFGTRTLFIWTAACIITHSAFINTDIVPLEALDDN